MTAKRTAESVRLAEEIRSYISRLPVANTESLRTARREFSRALTNTPPEIVLQIALLLLRHASGVPRFVAYEIVTHHTPTFGNLCTEDLLKLGEGLDSWFAVDCFAMYLSGPSWLLGRVPDDVIVQWAASADRWWRRAALVSTVALSRRGKADDIRKLINLCALTITDRDDMVVKALSWALRELAKKHPKEARGFLAEHKKALAARVIREVENKLTTGLKTPHRTAERA